MSSQKEILRGLLGERSGSGSLFRVSRRHHCDKPLVSDCAVGDLFVCDCGKQYELEESERDNYWGPSRQWAKK